MADVQNPYAPPHAPIQDIALKSERPRRPLWVWVIALSLGLVSVSVIDTLILRGLAFTPDLAALSARLTWPNVVVQLVFWCMVLTAAGFLFMLRVTAIRLFWAAVTIAALWDLSMFVFGWISDTDATPLGMLVKVVVWSSILAYAYRLKAKGVLR